MKQLAWFFKWTLKAAIFFTLFAFALNNQHGATVRFFFGQQWTAPLVLVVLSAFAAGLVIGVLGMVPRWWQHRRAAAMARHTPPVPTDSEKPSTTPPYGI
jgi:putative membrane protein